jgi:uncharacterized membrane protein
MKTLIGIVLIIAGIALGLYLGVWVMFIGGIVDIIDQIKSPELSAMAVAWGVVKIVFAGFIGWLVALILILPGIGMVAD